MAVERGRDEASGALTRVASCASFAVESARAPEATSDNATATQTTSAGETPNLRRQVPTPVSFGRTVSFLSTGRRSCADVTPHYTRCLMSVPALDVVIVSFRSRDFLRSCLTSLRAYPPASGARVWVVENASRDGTSEMVRSEFPEAELIVSETNLGFSTANNLAIRRGRAPYVLALNPDTRVTEGALDRLIRLMETDSTIGIAGCRLELEDGMFDHASRRSFPTPIGALGHFTGLARRSDAPRWLAQYRAPSVESGRVDAVNGAFMLMRRRALDDVGLFDEGYWMYMEDLDLCYRFAQAGWTTWYEPSVRVLHVKGGSSGRYRSARLNYAFHYGMYRFYRKHYAGETNPILNLAVYAAIAGKLGASLVRSAVFRRVAAVQRRGALDTRTGARPSES